MQSRRVSRDPGLSAVDLYAKLAAERAVEARIALRHSHGAGELVAQSAQALEDAADTLTLLSEMYAEDQVRFSHALCRQATAWWCSPASSSRRQTSSGTSNRTAPNERLSSR
jgi:hypothetical protein